MNPEQENEQQIQQQAPESAPKKTSTGGNKPVVVYIMILFIAAFLLMALSFAMHQRSNTQALGQLQNSVSTMQEVQATQEKIIELQDELATANQTQEELQKQLDQLQTELDNANATLDSADERLSAQSELYTLMQQYAAKDYESCSETIQRMEDNHWPALLSEDHPADSVTSPAERYQELKDAVETQLAQQEQDQQG
jgi:uroporphyrin-3 C-methyltransferase